MIRITGEIRAFRGWASFAIDAVAKGKTDVTALKVLIAMAIIVLPGGVVLDSAGFMYQGIGAMLTPATDSIQGPVISTSSADVPEAGTSLRQPALMFIATPAPAPEPTATPAPTPDSTVTPGTVLVPES